MPEMCSVIELRPTVAVLAFLGTTALAIAGEPRPPVALYTPSVMAPDEAAGTGLAPEIGVRVEIDEDGRVVEVETLSVQPSSELDGVFEEAIREALLRWRYSPAVQDGVPVPTALEWMVQFPTVAERQEEATTTQSWRETESDANKKSEEFRRRVARLSVDRRVDRLRDVALKARNAADPGTLKKASTDLFTVFTDAPDENLAQTLGNNLEATFRVLLEIVGKDVPPQPETYKIIAFMYGREERFEQLKREVEAFEWSQGFYNPYGLLAFHMQMPSNESLLSTMFHEATHAFMDRYLARPGVVFPRWLGEGFAEYVGNSQVKNGELVPGKTARSESYRGSWGARRGASLARLSVGEVKSAIRKGEGLTIADLIDADGDEFYGDKRQMFYPTAWLLVHFLRHGREEWTSDRFSKLLLYVAEGYPAPEVMRELYGDPSELETEFRDYVKRF